MLTVRADEAALKRISQLLEKEPAGARVRLKENVCGSGWGAKLMLGLSVTVRNEPGDEVCVVGGVPFVASAGVRMRHGETYEVDREWGVFVVRRVGRGIWN